MSMKPAPSLLIATLLGCVGLLPASAARAQSGGCSIVSVTNPVDLGPISSAGASSSGNVTFRCSHGYTDAPRTFTACLYMNPNNGDPAWVAPRRMLNYSVTPPHLIDFDLYADPGHTQILGSETSGHLVHSTSVHVDAAGPNNGWNPEGYGTLTFYARLPPGQPVAATGSYVSQITVALHYASQAGADNPPPDFLCAVGEEQDQYLEVTGATTSGCAVGIATDLDFGEVSSLTAPHDQTSTIHLVCPIGTTWQLGLDDGMHGSGGQRRMADSGGTAFVPYELYRDASHADRWGDELDADTHLGTGTGSLQQIPVHGRTLPQSPTPPPGVYSDTITVTLTF